MKLTYEVMEKFIRRYFDYYNKYSQKEKTAYKMDECWGNDFHATGYFGTDPIIHTSGLSFRESIVQVHKNISEKLIPLNIVVDERKKEVGVLLKVEKEVLKTGEKMYFTGIALYSIVLDEEQNPKLKSLHFCVNDPQKLTGMWEEDYN